MSTIISNSELQKNPGKFSKMVAKKAVIVTTHGMPKMIILPYFEDNEEWMQEYFENYEMWQNRERLQKEIRNSKKSGKSNFSL